MHDPPVSLIIRDGPRKSKARGRGRRSDQLFEGGEFSLVLGGERSEVGVGENQRASDDGMVMLEG